MKLKTLFVLLACLTAVVSCGNLAEQDCRVLYLNVDMMDVNHAKTKVSATETPNAINFAWQTTDVLNLMFEQNGSFYPAQISPKVGGVSKEHFVLVAPIQMELISTYSLYGALHTTIAPNSGNFVTLTGQEMYQQLNDVVPKLPFIFTISNTVGHALTTAMKIDAALIKVLVENKTGRPITLTNGLSLKSNGETWSFKADNIIIAKDTSAILYAPIYGDEKPVTAPLTCSATFNGKEVNMDVTTIPTEGKFEKGKCYFLKLKYNVSEEMTGAFELPSMPIEELFDSN